MKPAAWIGCLLVALVGSSATTAADPPPADAVRGGWVVDVDGARHIFILKVADGAITGTYCAVDCGDPARLAFVRNGTLRADGGVNFDIVRPGRQPRTLASVTGRAAADGLALEVSGRGLRPALPREIVLRRDPRKPPMLTVEELFERRGVKSGPLVIAGSSTPYQPPGPDEPLTPARLEDLWVWSEGPGRQHFIFRQVGDDMLGMVCGPCDNPWTFGPLDNFALRGDTLTFDIVHEDWGTGIEFGPYANHATATLVRHELHLRTLHRAGTREIRGDLVLTGPLRTDPR